jgi:hypothetical protein
MKAIGVGHPTKELTGLPRATTADDITRDIGMETTVTWNTITIRIRNMTATTTSTETTAIMTTAMTKATIMITRSSTATMTRSC